MQKEISIWHLVVNKVATLEELETTWSIDDVQRALALLNLKSDIEGEQQDDIKNASKRISH